MRWQRVWQRFLRSAKLPANDSWTASTYATNLPEQWPASRVKAAQEFLEHYKLQRFSSDEERAIEEVEQALDECLRVMAK